MLPFEGEARRYIEHNATDQDTGFHGIFDQEGLSEGCIVSPTATRSCSSTRPGSSTVWA